MPINPITLDKMEPIVIKQMENKLVDRIVHEIKGTEIQKEKADKEKNFNRENQKKAAEEFGFFLLKHNLKFEYKINKDKIKLKIKDKEGKIIIETEVDDIELLFDRIKKNTGSIIDIRG